MTACCAEAYPPRLAVSVANAASMLSISRPTIYRMIARGELATFKLGSRTLILRADLEALLDRLSQGAP